MATRQAKRRLEGGETESTKKRRISGPPSPEIDLDEYVDGSRNNDHPSDDEVIAETPITPFSPARKFPSDEKTISCPYDGCTKTFNRPARLASHLRSHTNERPFVCSYDGCDKTYLEEKHLKQHIKGSHTHERAYHCDWEGCTKSFLTATRLRRHREAHEGRERFRCTGYPPCDQTFRKHQTLQRHIRSEHLQLAAFSCPFLDPDTNQCCAAGFDNAGSLRKHQDRVHGANRFWCEECQAGEDLERVGFATKAQLQQHIRAEHANCMFCDAKFVRSVDLQNHLDAQHSGKSLAERKTVPCTYGGCGKSFTKKSNLDAHIRSTHQGTRFICGVMDVITAADLAAWKGTDACGKLFVSKANLEDHIRTQHVGLPSAINAKRHKKAAAGTQKPKADKEPISALEELTGEGYSTQADRKIPCTVPGCEWLFTRDYYLQNHIKTKHPELASQGSETFVDGTPEPSLLQGDLGIEASPGLNWEAGQILGADTPFWIGGENTDRLGDECQWLEDEIEMRRLIDADMADLDAVIDPVLQGL